jgi:alpha-tubulin suppressor-like RCC1 family protein
MDHFEVQVFNQELWNAARPGQRYQFQPRCVPLPDADMSCGQLQPGFAQTPFGQNDTEQLFFFPTTNTPLPVEEDKNPQDNKGYYTFNPEVIVLNVDGVVPPAELPIGKDPLTPDPLHFRCDNANYGGSLGSGGCIHTDVSSFVQFSCSDQTIKEAACFIRDAFEDITLTFPGEEGTFVPGEKNGGHGQLTRNFWENGGISKTKRDGDGSANFLCEAGYGLDFRIREDGQTNDCDEYPFLVTYQNVWAWAKLPPASAQTVAVKPVLSDHNQLLGSKLGSYYQSDRILDSDAYSVQIVDRGFCDGGGGGGGPVGDTNQGPVITVQPVTLEGNATGGYSGPIPGVTATDPDGDAVTLTNNAPATLPLGTTTIGWVARDPSGERTTASQTVTVVDTRAPSITCPPDATYDTVHPTLNRPSVHDVVDANPTVTNNAPARFPLGETTVTWTATDHSGNSATCTQKVEILYAPPLAGGRSHSLAVVPGGQVLAWGQNLDGQLGQGTNTDSNRPRVVCAANLCEAGIRAVSAGLLSSYALSTSGTVWAWGDNLHGELGNGTTNDSNIPVQVSGLSGVRQVAAGNYHVLAIKPDRTVVAWGENDAGQLGKTGGNSTTPVAVPGLTNVVQVGAGGQAGLPGHSVALKNDGTVWTWGSGKHGQLGLGNTRDTPTPTKVPGLTGVVQIAAGGDNTYALKSDGTVYAWGANDFTQIGNPAAANPNNQTTPIQVIISGVAAIAASTGGSFAMAIKIDGTVWEWGNNNAGQLGDGGVCIKWCDHPVRTGLTSAGFLAGGFLHALAATPTGSAYAWGANDFGQLGNGTFNLAWTPTLITGITVKH